MEHHLELGYLGMEIADATALGAFFTDVVGLVPGEPTADGLRTFRDDERAHRLLVAEGPKDDATFLGFEAADTAAFAATLERLAAAGFATTDGTAAEAAARRVQRLVHTTAPWGVEVELVQGLTAVDSVAPFEAPLVPGGFLTEGVGFGHVVFATTDFDESHRFAIDGLGLAQSDWLEMEIAEGITLEVRFYHCNSRHHSLALARAPFELPQALHHVMFETNRVDAVGLAFDRAWASGAPIANGLGKHDNDGMFSFYAVTPAGFQVEIGHGARLVDDDWDDNRAYDRISAWGHQPIPRP